MKMIKRPKFLLKKKVFMALVRQTLFKTITTGIGTTAVGFYGRGEIGPTCLNNNKKKCKFIAKE